MDMGAQDTSFEQFARGLIPAKAQTDPETLRKARAWYRNFAENHAVKMDDQELVELYLDLQ
jgi:hypothetical protein